jgi:uncharacterized protein YfaS (alpha-2-macroglobulin family)
MAGQVYVQGTTVRLKALDVVDVNGDPITSPSSTTIYVKKSDGTVTTITSGISNDGSGNYHYDLQIATADPVGGWIYQWSISNSPYNDNAQDSFTVEENLANG